jgi:diguanylate cyclase (GGDEF)-like protein
MIGIGALITVVFLSVGAMVMDENARRDYTRATNSAENVVTAIAAEITRNFELYDLSLQGVIDGLRFPEIARVPAPMRQQILFDRAATAKYLGSIFVLDRNGDLILDSRTAEPERGNHADREYFQAARDNNNGQMHLSAPWSTSEGEQLIAISRRLSSEDGSFRGAVVGTMRVSYFYGLLQKVKLGDGDRLTLARTDGTVVMRAPLNVGDIGRDVRRSNVFERALRDEAGSFNDSGSFDGAERLYVYRHVGNSPLILNYAQSLRSIYAGWWNQALQLGSIVALVSALNIALVGFLARALKRGAIAEHRLAVAATTDSLTGLCNRRRFDEIFEETWHHARRDNLPVAVLMIDVDLFKFYNDQFGHQAGDDALVEIAGCIRKGARRDGDVVARYGGEEFIVLLAGASPEDAVKAGEKIRSLVLQQRAARHGQAAITPTVSVGAASILVSDGVDRKELVRAADLALYLAKNNGRNRVELSTKLRLVDSAGAGTAKRDAA